MGTQKLKLASLWFKDLPVYAQKKAQANMKNDALYESLSKALTGSFKWERTPEDTKFWYALYTNAINDEAIEVLRLKRRRAFFAYVLSFGISALVILFIYLMMTYVK